MKSGVRSPSAIYQRFKGEETKHNRNELNTRTLDGRDTNAEITYLEDYPNLYSMKHLYDKSTLAKERDFKSRATLQQASNSHNENAFN